MDSKQNFIEIINRFIDGGKYNPPSDINWYEVEKLAEIHSMLGIMGIVINRSGISKDMPLECYEPCDYMVFESARQGIMFEMIYKDVTQTLNKANIDHIIVKGYVLRHLYPEKDMRSMGDIDFVIREKDLEQAKDILVQNGFSLNHIYRGEMSFEKMGVTVEITSSLVDADVGFFDYKKYMSNIFEHTILVHNSTYQLTYEFHYIYIILHTMKHFYAEGCGVRMMLDLALFVKKYKDTLDWDYINKELKYIKIDLFAKNMLAICYRLFGIGEYIDIDDNLYKEVYNYILDGGAFGFARKNYAISESRDRIAKNKSLQSVLLKKAFPNDKTMRGLIQWYEDKPRIFLPIAWIYRWIHSSIVKKGDLVKSVTLAGEKTESQKQLLLLKQLGLYKK